jgi:hypothetical protein
MKERVMWAEARWSDLLLLGLFVPVWLYTVYDLAAPHLESSRGLTEWLCFFIAPLLIWKRISGLRRKKS